MADDRNVIGEKPLIAQPEKKPQAPRTFLINNDSQLFVKQVILQKM